MFDRLDLNSPSQPITLLEFHVNAVQTIAVSQPQSSHKQKSLLD